MAKKAGCCSAGTPINVAKAARCSPPPLAISSDSVGRADRPRHQHPCQRDQQSFVHAISFLYTRVTAHSQGTVVPTSLRGQPYFSGVFSQSIAAAISSRRPHSSLRFCTVAQCEYRSACRSRKKASQPVSMKPLHRADRRNRVKSSAEESE